MTSMPNGSKTLSTGQISNDRAKLIIRLATIGASQIEIAEQMQDWGEPEQTAGWRIIGAYFRTIAEIDHKVEMGKAIARYEMLISACVRIQDWKGAMACQSQIDKLISKTK